jgi:uncharacterized protein YigA (DUF484 family)
VNQADLSAADEELFEPAKAGEPTWPLVRAFLLAHPEYFAGDRELHETLGLKPTGPNVVDFGRAALARLEAVVEREAGARKQIEQVARANFSAQAQTHAVVLDLLDARNHADLARRLDAAAKHRFGLTAGVIALESERVPAGWQSLEAGAVDRRVGEQGLSWLGPVEDDVELFGAEAGEVKSAALVRLALWSEGRPALVAFGSPEPDGFHAEMGAELVAFVARVTERTAERWPVL